MTRKLLQPSKIKKWARKIAPANKNDLEVDIRNSFIANKIRKDEQYAQRVYAALCNRKFFKKTDTFNILKDDPWVCSWRYAGGLVARIRTSDGDYMDFYCSGREGQITEEVKQDFEEIGWFSKEYNE